MKTAKLIVFWLCLGCMGYAQELNCVVQVNASQVQGTDRRIFETLQSSMFEFLNGRRWTTLNFAPTERIECNFTLIVQKRDPNSNEISGSLSVQVRRPVFNTTYNSVLLNFMDKDISFRYVEHDVLEFSDGSFHGNLTAILAYYAYMAIGLTFNSFGREAGMQFFDRAMEVVMRCQDLPATEATGWKSNSRNTSNRYWLAENFTNGNLRDIHEIYYIYYRRGLDQMYDNPTAARQSIFQSLEKLQRLNKQRPSLLVKQVFFDSSSEELINIFKMGTPDEKNRFIAIVRELDPANLNKYQAIFN
ncbi:MAG: DUF4835 family protein [Bacteroidales bacterium]|jgi:hypothetical protein|nr:DUF4835 family protein [Bacteroidales bacterium]